MESTSFNIKQTDKLDINIFKGVKPDIAYFLLKYGVKTTSYQQFCDQEDDKKIKETFYSFICERNSLYSLCSSFYRVALMNFNMEQRKNEKLYRSYEDQYNKFNAIFRDFSTRIEAHKKLLYTSLQTVHEDYNSQLSFMQTKMMNRKSDYNIEKSRLMKIIEENTRTITDLKSKQSREDSKLKYQYEEMVLLRNSAEERYEKLFYTVHKLNKELAYQEMIKKPDVVYIQPVEEDVLKHRELIQEIDDLKSIYQKLSVYQSNYNEYVDIKRRYGNLIIENNNLIEKMKNETIIAFRSRINLLQEKDDKIYMETLQEFVSKSTSHVDIINFINHLLDELTIKNSNVKLEKELLKKEIKKMNNMRKDYESNIKDLTQKNY